MIDPTNAIQAKNNTGSASFDGASVLTKVIEKTKAPPEREIRRDRAFPGNTVREMEAVNWASLSDHQLFDRRRSKLGST